MLSSKLVWTFPSQVYLVLLFQLQEVITSQGLTSFCHRIHWWTDAETIFWLRTELSHKMPSVKNMYSTVRGSNVRATRLPCRCPSACAIKDCNLRMTCPWVLCTCSGLGTWKTYIRLQQCDYNLWSLKIPFNNFDYGTLVDRSLPVAALKICC